MVLRVMGRGSRGGRKGEHSSGRNSWGAAHFFNQCIRGRDAETWDWIQDVEKEVLQSSPLPIPAHKQALSHLLSLANSVISHLPLNLDKEGTELQKAQTLKQANSCPNPDFSNWSLDSLSWNMELGLGGSGSVLLCP